MKNIVLIALILLFIGCGETQDSSPASVAKTVAESFYQGDEETLNKHTTPEGFANFSNLMKMFAKPKSSEMNFKINEKSIEGDVAWVKYSTSYDKIPGVFKLVKVDGVWKVTVREPREKLPF
ncbi:hypothetical protein [Maribacter litoralis]|uniref:hypothetical protein n=1 Tax=Maribacter litoralis TaxID=2059726 RepID=UPI003D270B6D